MRITKSENDASRVIRLLSDLLSVSLDTKTTIVTVAEEISYTKKYLEIESIKEGTVLILYGIWMNRCMI